MAAPRNVELEAAKFLHKLIQESTDEPTKMARKLYVILQHMRSSGKENSMPYQVISRAMETLIYLHSIDMEALNSSRLPLSGVTHMGDSSSTQFAGSSQTAAIAKDSKAGMSESEMANSHPSSRQPVGPSGAGHDIYQGSVSRLGTKSLDHESPSSFETRSANSQSEERHDTSNWDKANQNDGASGKVHGAAPGSSGSYPPVEQGIMSPMHFSSASYDNLGLVVNVNKERIKAPFSASPSVEHDGGTSDVLANANEMVQSGIPGNIMEMNMLRSAAPRDAGESPTSLAPGVSNIAFNEQCLKQLRAQCLVFLAFWNGLMPKKLHLEIALGNFLQNEDGSQKELIDHKGKELSINDPNNIPEDTMPFGRLNNVRETERVARLSSTGLLPETNFSRESEDPNIMGDKNHLPSDLHVQAEERKNLLSTRRKREAEVLTWEISESQPFLTKGSQLESLSVRGLTVSNRKDDLENGQQAGTSYQASSVMGISGQMMPEMINWTGIGIHNEAATGSVPGSMVLHESVQERKDNAQSQSQILADCNIGSPRADNHLPSFPSREHWKPISGMEAEHQTVMRVKDASVLMNNVSEDDRKISEIQRRCIPDGCKSVLVDDMQKNGSPAVVETDLEEEVISLCTDLPPSPKYATLQKWVMEQNKRRFLIEQNWALKQRKTEQKIAACSEKLKHTMSASGLGRGRKRKNAAGHRSDLGWEHDIEVDAASKKVKCKYCNVICSEGIYRLKHHLACNHQNVDPSPQVSEDVREKFMSLLRTKTLESQNKKRRMLDIGDDDSDEEVELLHAGHEYKQKHYGRMDKFVVNKFQHQNQKTINQLYKKEERDDVCQTIARFFYTSAIPFNCVNNPIFPLMVKKIGDYGKGLVPPSCHEIRVTFLKKEVRETLQLLDEFKEQWKKTGCTIISDGWSDRKRRSICNFLVNSPNGTIFLSSLDTSDISKTDEKVFEMLDEVVEKVGVEHVVQVVTDNASNYKLAGEMLMNKRKSLFWMPCAAHCIDLMLEDFEKQIQLHRVTIKKGKRIVAYIYSRTNLIHWMKEFTKGIELIRPAVTRFATSYLTLRRLHEQKGALFSLFTSPKWRNSRFSRSEKGKKIEDIVLDNRIFWKDVSMCLKAAVPLIKVLRLVDSDEHPVMGFIHEAMDRAKEEIQSNFNNVFSCYDPIWTIIDRRWESQLHHPLHAAAYFLNPQFHYSPNFQPDVEVKIGLYKCLERMVPDADERVKIDLQIDVFKSARGLFGIQNAIMTRKKKSPVDWWDSFGDECPELKRFAIRILSLTCSSSGCERNWSAFEMVHSKRRNRLHQKRMNDLVFVMYNLKLRQRHMNRQAIMNSFCLDDIPSDDEWITERESPTLPREGNWLSVLDRNARHGCDSDEDEVEALARNLEQACRDHISGEHDEVHEVSDDDAMDQNMDA